MSSIFNMCNIEDYKKWKVKKLNNFPDVLSRIVPIRNALKLSNNERSAIIKLCNTANLAIYSGVKNVDKEGIIKFAAQFNLSISDRPIFVSSSGVSEICSVDFGQQSEYAPYSNKPLNWHTDGYYNAKGSEVFSFILHCVEKAQQGGETALLDPEIIYILLRDMNPEYINVLMQPDIFKIDANVQAGKIIRPSQIGPVFSVIRGRLHMRFSARKRYVSWKKDSLLSHARGALNEILEDKNKYVIRHTLSPGEGIICNNVLHCRTSFEDGAACQRRFFRARFIDPVGKTFENN